MMMYLGWATVNTALAIEDFSGILATYISVKYAFGAGMLGFDHVRWLSLANFDESGYAAAYHFVDNYTETTFMRFLSISPDRWTTGDTYEGWFIDGAAEEITPFSIELNSGLTLATAAATALTAAAVL